MTFTLNKEIQEWLRERASQEDRTLSAIVRRILEHEMNNERDE